MDGRLSHRYGLTVRLATMLELMLALDTPLLSEDDYRVRVLYFISHANPADTV